MEELIAQMIASWIANIAIDRRGFKCSSN